MKAKKSTPIICNKPGRKPTGRLRKKLNLTFSPSVRRKIERHAYRRGISISLWLESVAVNAMESAEKANSNQS